MPYKPLVSRLDNFLYWLFAHGTRVVEFLNSALLIGFTFPLIYNLDTVLNSSTYPKIYLLGNPFWWSGMAILGLLQILAMSKKGVRSNQISGYFLMISGWVWAMIATLFLTRSEAATPAPIVYLIIAFICAVAGLYLLRFNKKVEDGLQESKG